MGKTGYNIHRFLKLLLTKLNLCINTSYYFYIINPVPYQASLGLSPINKSIRDKVWACLWDEKPLKLQDEFSNLLKSLPNNSIILNACTGGISNPLNLNGIIDIFIRKQTYTNKMIRYGRLKHPCYAPNYISTIKKLVLHKLP